MSYAIAAFILTFIVMAIRDVYRLELNEQYAKVRLYCGDDNAVNAKVARGLITEGERTIILMVGVLMRWFLPRMWLWPTVVGVVVLFIAKGVQQ